jgi:enamine deaminase RidA (YjgF/YER057c/UK114 family)
MSFIDNNERCCVSEPYPHAASPIKMVKREMEFVREFVASLDVNVGYSVFERGTDTSEIHMMMEPKASSLNFGQQLQNLVDAVDVFAKQTRFLGFKVVLKRYFLSDAANQYSHLQQSDTDGKPYAVSAVQQPPLGGSKVAVWVYWVKGADIHRPQPNVSVIENNGYKHLWTTQMVDGSPDVEAQTTAVFNNYTRFLGQYGCNLKDHCIRTWLYVQNVDVNYAGVVKARKVFFDDNDMTEKTHYIASTGIEGRFSHPNIALVADAYAVQGILTDQIKFLQAPLHLNPTYEYGVTFERGTSIDFGDRRHIYISGTASIDNKGDIVHPGDIMLQTHRALENIEALLNDADAQLSDMAHLIVYLRDTADYNCVKQFLDTQLPKLPKVIVLAPVCRPGWLIEMECVAIKAITKNNYRNF